MLYHFLLYLLIGVSNSTTPAWSFIPISTQDHQLNLHSASFHLSDLHMEVISEDGS